MAGSRRLAVIGGVAGPAAFVTGWVVGGFQADSYSAFDDPISRLAADGAPTRAVMTAGFLGFGAGVAAYAAGAGGRRPLASRVAAAVAALATVGVAATPLDAGVDGLHAAFAGTAYAAMAAVPVTTFPGRRSAAVASIVIAAALVASTVDAVPTGVFQRLGLTIADGWIIASALALSRRPR